jgi:cytoskeletal protein CcmA (bactofilin family)
MFSSKSKNSEATSVPMPPVSQQKRAGRSSAPSIISADLVVNGTLTSTGDIQIDGRVEGDVRSTGLVVGDKAFIQGEVLAEDLTVRGRIQGSIRARKVLLCATCHVEGNILHEAFSVEAGAFFEGNCRHSDNPLSEEAGRKTTEFKPAAVAPAPAPAAVAPVVPAQPMMRPADAPPRPAATFAPLKTGG